MNSLNKTSTILIAIIAIVFGIGVFAFTQTAFAIGGDAGGSGGGGGSIGDGCCSPSKPPSNPPKNPPSNPPTGCTSNCNPPKEKEYGKCDAFNASPTKVKHGGEHVTLSWNTTNAQKVTINNGVGQVADDGSKTVFVDSNTTFVLTVDGEDGDDTCQVSVTVKEKPQLSCDLFTVSKSKVEEDERFTLRWETTGATSVSINQGIGSVSADGSRTESVDDDTTYILTASNSHETVTCKVSVKVEEDEKDRLRCDLEISDDEIEKGDSVRLSWDNDGADEILLKDDRGNVLVDTDDGDNYDVDEDDIKVKPTRDTEYRLTVYGKNGDKKTCEVDVEVDDKKVTVDIDRNQNPIVIGIPLTHVPYTGFEAGPIMTTLFYILLAVWGLAIAYILVVKRGSVFGFALNGDAKQESTVAASTMTAAAPIYTPVYDYAPAETPVVEADDTLAALDNKAHDARVLLSTDARNFVASMAETREGQLAVLESVISAAKATYPTENGWVVLNKARVEELIG